jgi:flavin reductase (DIM6/NTAB) family NADH-FMN oxidoreductase RutF
MNSMDEPTSRSSSAGSGFDTRGRPSASPERFRDAFRLHPEGVTIVTARDEFGDQLGMTATSVTSVSLDPPLLLVCINRASRMTSSLSAGASFVVHFLAADQEEVAGRFARSLDDKFEHVRYRITSSGCPRLEDALAAVECANHEVFLAGDHVIVVGRVVDVRINRQPEAALAFFDGKFAALPLEQQYLTTDFDSWSQRGEP